jgi:hypothetical protein
VLLGAVMIIIRQLITDADDSAGMPRQASEIKSRDYAVADLVAYSHDLCVFRTRVDSSLNALQIFRVQFDLTLYVYVNLVARAICR